MKADKFFDVVYNDYVSKQKMQFKIPGKNGIIVELNNLNYIQELKKIKPDYEKWTHLDSYFPKNATIPKVQKVEYMKKMIKHINNFQKKNKDDWTVSMNLLLKKRKKLTEFKKLSAILQKMRLMMRSNNLHFFPFLHYISFIESSHRMYGKIIQVKNRKSQFIYDHIKLFVGFGLLLNEAQHMQKYTDIHSWDENQLYTNTHIIGVSNGNTKNKNWTLINLIDGYLDQLSILADPKLYFGKKTVQQLSIINPRLTNQAKEQMTCFYILPGAQLIGKKETREKYFTTLFGLIHPKPEHPCWFIFLNIYLHSNTSFYDYCLTLIQKGLSSLKLQAVTAQQRTSIDQLKSNSNNIISEINQFVIKQAKKSYWGNENSPWDLECFEENDSPHLFEWISIFNQIFPLDSQKTCNLQIKIYKAQNNNIADQCYKNYLGYWSTNKFFDKQTAGWSNDSKKEIQNQHAYLLGASCSLSGHVIKDFSKEPLLKQGKHQFQSKKLLIQKYKEYSKNQIELIVNLQMIDFQSKNQRQNAINLEQLYSHYLKPQSGSHVQPKFKIVKTSEGKKIFADLEYVDKTKNTAKWKKYLQNNVTKAKTEIWRAQHKYVFYWFTEDKSKMTWIQKMSWENLLNYIQRCSFHVLIESHRRLTRLNRPEDNAFFNQWNSFSDSKKTTEFQIALSSFLLDSNNSISGALDKLQQEQRMFSSPGMRIIFFYNCHIVLCLDYAVYYGALFDGLPTMRKGYTGFQKRSQSNLLSLQMQIPSIIALEYSALLSNSLLIFSQKGMKGFSQLIKIALKDVNVDTTIQQQLFYYFFCRIYTTLYSLSFDNLYRQKLLDPQTDCTATMKPILDVLQGTKFNGIQVDVLVNYPNQKDGKSPLKPVHLSKIDVIHIDSMGTLAGPFTNQFKGSEKDCGTMYMPFDWQQMFWFISRQVGVNNFDTFQGFEADYVQHCKNLYNKFILDDVSNVEQIEAEKNFKLTIVSNMFDVIGLCETNNAGKSSSQFYQHLREQLFETNNRSKFGSSFLNFYYSVISLTYYHLIIYFYHVASRKTNWTQQVQMQIDEDFMKLIKTLGLDIVNKMNTN